MSLRQQRRREQYDAELTENPTVLIEQNARIRARMEVEPSYADHVRALKRTQQRRRDSSRRNDPEQNDQFLERRRRWYADHRDEVIEKRRIRKETMAAERLEFETDRKREYDRERHEALKNDPEAYKAWLDSLSESHRQRALANFILIGSALLERSKDD